MYGISDHFARTQFKHFHLQIHIQFVENMLQVHHKYEELIAHTFKNDPLFLSALDKACSSVINKRINEKQTCRSAELVRTFFAIDFSFSKFNKF